PGAGSTRATWARPGPVPARPAAPAPADAGPGANAASAVPAPARAGCPSVVAAATAAASGPAAPAAWRWRAAPSPARPGVRRGPAPPAATGTPTDARATVDPARDADPWRRPGRASPSAAASAPLPRTIRPRPGPLFFSPHLFWGRVAGRQDEGALLAQPGCLQRGGHVLDRPGQRRCVVVPRRPSHRSGFQGGLQHGLAKRMEADRADPQLLAGL